MKKMLLKKVAGTVALLGLVSASFAATAVERHGALTTSGHYILNKNGNIVQLRGMSFYWSTASWGGIGYYNESTVAALVNDWKCTVLRVAYDPGESWPAACENVVKAAISKGIYVIIDWHSHTAQDQEAASINFFKGMAGQYKNTPNVIFEPFNEPITINGDKTDGSQSTAMETWKKIKGYHKNVTQAIRDAGAPNLVILGTPYFCQFVNVAADDPPLDKNGKPFTNVAYAFHFYAASHGPEAYFVKQATDGKGGLEQSYLERGWNSVPVFITEWGTTHSDGGQRVDAANTDWWFKNYVNKADHYLSTCNWSASNKSEASAAFTSGTNPSESGTVARKYLLNQSTDEYPTAASTGNKGPSGDSTFAMPGTHPAAGYNMYFGGSIGAAQVPYLDWDDKDVRTAANQALKILPGTTADWVSYKFNAASATSKAVFRILAKNGTGTVDIAVDGKSAGTLTIAKGAGWVSTVVDVAVSAGEHVFKLTFTNAATDGFLIEWIELTNNPTVITPIRQVTLPNSLVPSAIATFQNGFAFSLAAGHGFTGYRITTPDGRMVKSNVIASTDRIVQVNGLVPGVFFIELTGKNTMAPQRVMISGR